MVLTNNLKIVDFGHCDAEADPNLIRYFLETESYHRILSGEKMYVIGRKGTGKSAIYKVIEKLEQNPENKKLLSVAALTFDTYPWQIHNKIKDETCSLDFAHVNTWRYIILLELAKLIIKENDAEKQDLNEIKSFIQKTYGSLTPSFKELLVDKLKRIIKLEIPKISDTGIGGGGIELDNRTPEKKLIDSINILNDTLQDKIFKLLNKSKLYFVLFDKLDDGWDNSDEFKSSMVGLLKVCRDLNLQSRSVDIKLRCIPFLRSDIYETLQYNDKNKAFQDIESLNWNPITLRKIINKRISYSLNCQEENAWELIFENKPLARKTTKFNYIIKRTLLRPRDIIAFCDLAKKEALKNSQNKITNSDIYSSETNYSEYIYQDFLDEAHKQHPYVEQFFEVLRSLLYERFSYDEFLNEYNKHQKLNTIDVNSALKILFDLSIIGVERIGGAAGGSMFEFKYTDPHIQPEFKKSMVIHPALKKILKLTEKRKKYQVEN